nr:PREDICTED: tip elongation aberrant protein 1-like isoform X2 [Daucus carota subsp. sativus]
MRWEKLEIQTKNGEGLVGPPCSGPGKRWGHTCNSIGGGKFLYVFGGYGEDNCQTNKIHIFDTANRTWSEPVTNGEPPKPRDSHSCTTVEDYLFIFGGTDGSQPLKDLHIFDTSLNTWSSPCIRGEGPEAREGHSAALVGKRLFIFGGCGKSSSGSHEEYYDDLYILNTETFVWKRAVTSGTPPAKRNSHTCSSWKNKIIVIGGEDLDNFYLSDVHFLDTDTLIWGKVNTLGQLMPPRAGHTTVALGKNLFVFGGFSDEQNLYDDIYNLDFETGYWTKVMTTGDGPSARFSMAGDSLDPTNGGVLVFIGGCNKNLEALDDMYYLRTGILTEPERDERRVEKLSLRKQLKLKCQESTLTPVYDKALVKPETQNYAYQSVPATNFVQQRRQNIHLHEYQAPPGKSTFQAQVTTCLSDGFTIETVIDGKTLRGVLFSTKTGANDLLRKQNQVEVGGSNAQEDHNLNNSPISSMQEVLNDRQADGAPENSVLPDNQIQANTSSNVVVSDAAHLYEAPSDIKLSVAPDVAMEKNNTVLLPYSNSEDTASKTPAAAALVTSPPEQDGRALTAESQFANNLLHKADSIQLGS